MKAFVDTNILVYAFSKDPRAERARALLETRPLIGVQCLNEFATVARRKLDMDWLELRRSLHLIRRLCAVEAPVTVGLHEAAIDLAEQYNIAIFDALIVAAALACECEVLWSEDMHHGLVIENSLTIRNPFLPD